MSLKDYNLQDYGQAHLQQFMNLPAAQRNIQIQKKQDDTQFSESGVQKTTPEIKQGGHFCYL